MVQLGSKTYEVPFIICGDGGHNVNQLVQATKGQPAQEPDYGADVSYMDQKPADNFKRPDPQTLRRSELRLPAHHRRRRRP